MPRVMGIVNFEEPHISLKGINEHRPISATSYLGRYRIVDFPLSNLTNSGIQNIQVYMKVMSRSLVEHLGTGRQYNINSKRGKLHILCANDEQSTDINVFYRNMDITKDTDAEYVVITPSYLVYNIDFNKVIEKHIESKADITMVYKAVDNAREHYIGLDTLTIDNENRIEDFHVNLGKYKNRNVSLETYVMKKDLFLDLILQAKAASSMYWLKDIVKDNVSNLNIHGYHMSGHCFCINSLDDYYAANMKMLDLKTATNFLTKNWPIHTQTNDSVPAYYDDTANVKCSIIANGCQIRGRVSNCILGRGVIVEKGANIENSVVMPGVYIGKDVNVSYAIIDKKAVLNKVKDINGESNRLIYIHRCDNI
ncbi:MAG: glucose-1-phosphate adenylyltransferase subunit GlgD [Erysipelotrichaceae bacterium]